MGYDMRQSGGRIRQLRIQNGYTQEALASKLSINRSVLSRIEAGKYACSIDILAQISAFFDVSIDYLVFGKSQNQNTTRLKDDITNLIFHLECFKECIQQ